MRSSDVGFSFPSRRRGRRRYEILAADSSNGVKDGCVTVTLLRLGSRRRLADKVALLEGTPFEVLLVAAALDIALLALETSGFGLVTLEALILAGDAA